MEPIDLSALEAELAGDGPMIESSAEAMHLWIAAGQLLYSLSPDDLVDEIKAEFPRYMNPESVRDLFREAREEGDVATDRLMDELGDFAKLVIGRLSDWLEAHGLGDAAFLVYFPCHNGNGTLVLKDKTTGTFKLREW